MREEVAGRNPSRKTHGLFWKVHLSWGPLQHQPSSITVRAYSSDAGETLLVDSWNQLGLDSMLCFTQYKSLFLIWGLYRLGLLLQDSHVLRNLSWPYPVHSFGRGCLDYYLAPLHSGQHSFFPCWSNRRSIFSVGWYREVGSKKQQKHWSRVLSAVQNLGLKGRSLVNRHRMVY